MIWSHASASQKIPHKGKFAAFLVAELSLPGLSEGVKLNNTVRLSDWWVPNSSRYRSGLFRTRAGSIPHWACGGGGCGTRDVFRPAAGGQETAEGDAGVFSTALSGGEESRGCYESRNERRWMFPKQFCGVDSTTQGGVLSPTSRRWKRGAQCSDIRLLHSRCNSLALTELSLHFHYSLLDSSAQEFVIIFSLMFALTSNSFQIGRLFNLHRAKFKRCFKSGFTYILKSSLKCVLCATWLCIA